MEYLLTNRPGRAFVDLYYRTSPPIAGFITEHPRLKPIVQGLDYMPAVAISAMIVNTTATDKLAILVVLLLITTAAALCATGRYRRGTTHA
jgi:hypothetical protein